MLLSIYYFHKPTLYDCEFALQFIKARNDYTKHICLNGPIICRDVV